MGKVINLSFFRSSNEKIIDGRHMVETLYLNSKKNALTMTIADAFYYAAENIRAAAIKAAHKVVEMGGDFCGAMEAAELVVKDAGVLPYEPSTEAEREAAEHARNNIRRMKFQHQQRELFARRRRLAEVYIRFHMRRCSSLEIDEALQRADRVIQGNGLAATAIYFALNRELPESTHA